MTPCRFTKKRIRDISAFVIRLIPRKIFWVGGGVLIQPCKLAGCFTTFAFISFIGTICRSMAFPVADTFGVRKRVTEEFPKLLTLIAMFHSGNMVRFQFNIKLINVLNVVDVIDVRSRL